MIYLKLSSVMILVVTLMILMTFATLMMIILMSLKLSIWPETCRAEVQGLREMQRQQGKPIRWTKFALACQERRSEIWIEITKNSESKHIRDRIIFGNQKVFLIKTILLRFYAPLTDNQKNLEIAPLITNHLFWSTEQIKIHYPKLFGITKLMGEIYFWKLNCFYSKQDNVPDKGHFQVPLRTRFLWKFVKYVFDNFWQLIHLWIWKCLPMLLNNW